jgi:hypothetical protein
MGSLLTVTLFGSVIWTVVSVVLFLTILFASDIEENGIYAFVSLIVFGVIYYFWGTFEPLLIFLSWKMLSLYFVVGLIYSIVRTFFEGRTLGEDIKDLPDEKPNVYSYNNKESQKNIFFDELKGNVFRWWFMWPISLINWAVTDLIADIWDYLYSKMKKFYNLILELGIKSVK